MEAAALVVALSIIAPQVFAVPYVLLFFGCLTVVLVCLFEFRSLRNLRRKRNWVIYPVLVLVFSLIVFQAYAVSRDPTYVSYQVDAAGEPTLGTVNQLNVTSTARNGEASYFIVLKSLNASFSDVEMQNCVYVNSTMVKVPFTFQAAGSETQLIPFAIDANATGFAFYTSLEKQDGSRLSPMTFTSWVIYAYNAASGKFEGEQSIVCA